MEISPAVQPPKSGDPITAKWAADLADAVNSAANPAERTGEAATPYGKAAPAPGLPMLGEFRAPMPFDCRIVYNGVDAKDHLLCCIPACGEQWASYVFINQNPCANSSSQTIGTASNPWVDTGIVDTSSNYYELVLAFEDIPGALPNDYQFKWRLSLLQNPTGDRYPAWASWRAPLVRIASVSRASSPSDFPWSVIQFTRGFVGVGGSGWNLGGYEDNAWGKSVGNSSKAKVLDLDNRQLVGGWESTGDFTVANGTAKFFYGGNQYHPVNITDGNGNTYTVLAKV